MVENFSWVENKQDNFKEYVLNLADDNVEDILGNIPSGWNYPPTSHRGFVEWLIDRIKPEVSRVRIGPSTTFARASRN